MAQKKKLKTSQIKPSQNFLKEHTFNFIHKCIDEQREEDLPKAPLVKKIGDTYVAIDGHNLIAVFDELKRDIEVYIVKSAADIPKVLKDTPREYALKTKFDYVDRMFEMTQKEHIDSFGALRKNGVMKGD